MKYVVLLILGLFATNAVAQPRDRQGGQRRYYAPSQGPAQSQSVAPPSGNPYGKMAIPGRQPSPGSAPVYTQQPEHGSRTRIGASPYYRTYTPEHGSSAGTVDVPYSRNRIVRRAEETRSSSPAQSESSRTRPSSNGKAAIQQGVTHSRMVPGYDRPTMEPRELREAFRGSTSRISDAMENRSSEDVSQEVEAVRARVTEMKGRLRNEPVENQLKLSSIERMYNEGAASLEEGHRMGDENKMRMGLEKIEKANQRFEEIE